MKNETKETLEIVYKKNSKGHDIFINNEWVMWVIGSIRNAKKEAESYIKAN